MTFPVRLSPSEPRFSLHASRSRLARISASLASSIFSVVLFLFTGTGSPLNLASLAAFFSAAALAFAFLSFSIKASDLSMP